MTALLQLSRWIDAFTERIGRSVSWLVLITVVISAGNAIMRKVFNNSSNALLEIQWYLFSALFLLCAGYTLLRNEHVRIDIINGRFSARTRAWIDIFGFVFFFFPMVYLFVSLGWPFFMMSFSGNEMSSNAGGLIRWPVKLLLPLGFALLALQGLSELIKRFAFLKGLIGDPTEKGGISAEEELAAAIAATAAAARRNAQ